MHPIQASFAGADRDIPKRIYLAFPSPGSQQPPDGWSPVGDWYELADGALRLDVPTWGELDLWLWSDISGPVRVRQPVEDSARTDLGTVRLPEGVLLAGEVWSAEWSPPELHVRRQGAPSEARAHAGRPRVVGTLDGVLTTLAAYVKGDARGRWAVDGLDRATYVVDVVRVGGAPMHAALAAAASRTFEAPRRNADFELQAVILSVWVGSQEALPRPGLRISVADPEGRTTPMEAPPIPWPAEAAGPPGERVLALRPDTDYVIHLEAEGYLPNAVPYRSPPARHTAKLILPMTPR